MPGPLVLCLTSPVAASLTAQSLAACGTHAIMPREDSDVRWAAGRAQAILINLGGAYHDRLVAMHTAIEVAQAAGIPWLLDPVGAGGAPWRSDVARDLMARRPDIVKGNAAEIRALAGKEARLRGISSLDTSETARGAAVELSQAYGGCVVVTGAEDLVVSSLGVKTLTGGHAYAPKLVATGCALGGVMAACLAVSPAPEAARQACGLFKRAAEQAGAKATGLGSFVVGLLDSLEAEAGVLPWNSGVTLE